MSRKLSKPTESIDETTEEISPIEEMDEVALPLIKRVTIMAGRVGVLTAFVAGVVIAAPVLGLADQPLHSEHTPVVVEEADEKPPGLLGGIKNTLIASGGALKDNAVAVYKGVMDGDEKLSRANQKIEELVERNAQLEKELATKYVTGDIDHRIHLSCAKQLVVYMDSITPKDDGDK